VLTATKDGITLSSTTATQEVLDKAVGVTPEESAAASAESAAQAESASESEADNSQESEEAGEKPVKGKGGFQRKIDKDRRRITQLSEALEEERLARQRLEAQLAGKPAGAVEKPNEADAGATEDTEPDENAVNPKTGKPWTSWKEFNAEHTRWVLRQEKLAESAKASQNADQTELQKTFQAHAERLTAAKAKYSDWDTVSESLNKEATVPEGVAMTLVELDNGPDVIYHLAKNPEVLKELRGMSDVRAIAKIGVISDKLAAESKTAADKAAAEKGATDAAAKAAADKSGKKPDGSPAKQQVNSASPDPINPVGGGSSATTVDRSKMSTTDWIKQRNAGQIK
jgi:hypothetical protein